MARSFSTSLRRLMQVPGSSFSESRCCSLLPLLLLVSPRALALLLRGCATSDSDLVCKMGSLLNVLYGIAIFLGLALILAIWAAFRSVERNRDDRSDRR